MKTENRGNIGGLAERLKKSRERVRLERKQVADQLTISASTLSDYEIGHRQPSLPVLVALSEIYGVSTDYLLGKVTADPYPLDTVGLNENQIEVLRHMIDVMKHG